MAAIVNCTSAKILLIVVGNEMVASILFTVKSAVVVAARYSLLAVCDAVIVAVPAPTMVTVDPSMVATVALLLA